MKNYNTKIVMPYGKQKELGKLFPDVSRVWISRALNGHTNSDMSRKIREAALNAGGKELL